MDQIKLFEETFGISLITTNQIHMSLFGRQLFLAWLVLLVWANKSDVTFLSPVMGPKKLSLLVTCYGAQAQLR